MVDSVVPDTSIHAFKENKDGICTASVGLNGMDPAGRIACEERVGNTRVIATGVSSVKPGDGSTTTVGTLTVARQWSLGGNVTIDGGATLRATSNGQQEVSATVVAMRTNAGDINNPYGAVHVSTDRGASYVEGGISREVAAGPLKGSISAGLQCKPAEGCKPVIGFSVH